MKTSAIEFCIAVVASAWAAGAPAATLHYEINAVGSGSFGAAVFAAADYSFSGIADTATNQQCVDPSGPVPGCVVTILNSLKLSINGLGSFNINGPAFIFDNQSANIFGIGVSPYNFVLYGNISNESSVFASYDLASEIGPISTSALLQPTSIGTDRGTVQFVQGISPATFRVAATTPMPEPQSWAMLIGGFSIVGAIRRRKVHALVS